MSEELRESLSALMDGEASEEDIERVLDSLDDESVRRAWAGYQRAGQSLAAGAGENRFNIDISRRVRAAVADEPALEAPVNAVAEAQAPVEIRPVARWQRFTGPVTSFAVAASVCAAVLLGTQYVGTSGDDAGAASSVVAAGERLSTGGVVSALGGAATRADFSTPGVRTAPPVSDYDALARDRLQRYLLPHTEEAALNGPRGMMPFARVASFETEE